MKQLSASAVAAAVLALTSAAPAAAPITLVDDGKPAATIVIADQPTNAPPGQPPSGVVYAAEELQRFIEKASGARLEIVPATRAPAKGTLLLVGRSALTEKYKLALPTQPEGLRIVSFKRGVAILGEVAPAGADNSREESDRGSLHGVYEFLERVVGYRFFIDIPDDQDLGTVTPEVKTLTVPAKYKLEMAPDFPFRKAAFAHPVPRVTRESTGPGFPGVNATDSFFGEWFSGDKADCLALITTNGARSSLYPCYSHPGVLSARVQATQDAYDGKGRWIGQHCHPGPKWIGCEPEGGWDRQGLCLCDRCRPQYQPERGRYGKSSNLIFRHGVEYAAEIRKRWPDKRLGMMATEGHMLPPDFALPDNLDIQLCMMWSTTMGKEPYWHDRNVELMREWSRKLGGRRERLYVWNFFCWPKQWTEAPLFFPHNLQKWLQDTYPFSGGEYVSAGFNPPQFELVMAWLWHRLLWDRHADVDELLRDQCRTLFGPAGPTMEKLYTTVIDRYENVRWSRQFDESYVPPEQMYGETYPAPVIAALKQLLQEALGACPQGETNLYRRRVAWMQAGFAPFFAEADLAHQWLGKTQSYTVASVAAVPADAAAWAALPAATLAQGQYGAAPDLTAKVRLALCGSNVFVRFEAGEPIAPMIMDRLAIFVKGAKRQPAFYVNGEGDFPNYLPEKLAGYTYADGVWTVMLKCQAAALGIDPGQAKTVEVQFERKRGARGKVPATDYYWTPPMRPRSPEQMRFGRLDVEVTR